MRFPGAVALAPAKLNLGLEVVRRRADGYHEVITILQTVSIFDRFEWYATGDSFDYEPPPGLEADHELAGRALASHANSGNWTGTLRLRKGIPLAAGLGGGSSDAALALRLARRDMDAGELERLGAGMGSDVPFFIRGGTALATGTGTSLEPLPTPVLWFVVLVPPVHIQEKTARLYAALNANDFSDGSSVRSIADSIRDGRRPGDRFPNAFFGALLQYDEIRHARDVFERAGARAVNVSGAGPTLFAVADSYGHAARVAARISSFAGRVYVARSIPGGFNDVALQTMALQVRDT